MNENMMNSYTTIDKQTIDYSFFINNKIVRLLIDAGADVKSMDKEGDTILHRAVKGGYFDIVKELVGMRIDINLANNKGETPLWQALS